MTPIFPYPILAGALNLRVRSVMLDGVKVLPDFVDTERRVITISELGKSDWNLVSLRLRLDAPLTELAGKTAPWSDVAAYAVVNCAPSNTRTAEALTADTGTPARWEGEVELDRADWFGNVSLGGNVTATVDGRENRVIASAEPWSISLEDLPRPPIGQAMTIKWERFRSPEEGRKYLQDYSDDPYFLRIDSTDPILFLNQDFEGLEGLLGDRRRRPAAERALHDQTRASIAAEAWLALFLDALDHAELDEDDVVWPEEQWRVSALRSVLEGAYGATDDETLRRALTEWSDPDAASALLERAIPAAGRQARHPRLLRSAIRTLPNIEDVEVADDQEVSA
jgi:hypothetical protein